MLYQPSNNNETETVSNTPSSTGASRFGWSRPARIEEFNRLLHQPRVNGETDRFEFQGRLQSFPIITISIDLPKYRLTNGRTCSLQAEFLAKNPNIRPELFSGDAEMFDAQEEQHKLLLSVANASGLREKFEDVNQRQVETLVLDEYGYVVNGNRRLATWRDLLEQNPQSYSHFRNIDVVILPPCDSRDIDRLEAKLQIERDIKANYNWDALANMMKRHQVRNGLSNAELADLYGMNESGVIELLDMLAYADEYLRSRNKSNLWSVISDDKFAFNTLVKVRDRVVGIGKKELLKQAAFTLIDNPDEAGGRLYSSIKDIADHIDVVRDKLQDRFNVTAPQSDAEVDDLFGTSSNSNNSISDSVDVALAAHIQISTNSSDAREVIVEAIESQRLLKKDAKTSTFLLKRCAKAQSELTDAVRDGLRPESSIQGVEQQLQQIEGLIDRIRQFIQK